jgi:uncharacterized protein YrrD
MLNSSKTLQSYKLDSLDGEIGEVKELYFDDQHWTIRYLVANIGNWLKGKQVLISPHDLATVVNEEQRIKINLTNKQIEESPSLDNDNSFSRQVEDAYPSIMRDRKGKKTWDTYLRRTHDVTGHHIQAANGEIGHVVDFIIDNETWEIRYLLIDTRNLWPGKKVLISKQWIERISWIESKVIVNLPIEVIKLSPKYTKESLLTRDHETILHQHYNHQFYWIDRANYKNKFTGTTPKTRFIW